MGSLGTIADTRLVRLGKTGKSEACFVVTMQETGNFTTEAPARRNHNQRGDHEKHESNEKEATDFHGDFSLRFIPLSEQLKLLMTVRPVVTN